MVAKVFLRSKRGTRKVWRLSSGCLVALCFVLFPQHILAAASDLERGKYLVEALTACDNCHTPRSPDGYDLSRRFSGGAQVFSDKDHTVRGSNISSDAECGVGAWSDSQLRAALVYGEAPNGRLAPFMPSESYRALTPADADAILAFVRTASPAKSCVTQQERRGVSAPRRGISGAEKPFSDNDLADPLRKGLYFASLARCMSCHSGDIDGAPDPENHLGQGGKVFHTPTGDAVASNITSHPQKGIGAWTNEEIKNAITKGISRDGRPLAPTMANLSKTHFSKMEPADLDSLIAWLRTVPPLE